MPKRKRRSSRTSFSISMDLSYRVSWA